MVEHRNLANYLNWVAMLVATHNAEYSLVHSNINFDLAITTLLPPLLTGDYIKLLSDVGENQVTPLSQELSNSNAGSFIKLTPSHLSALLLGLDDEKFLFDPAMIVVGGELLTSTVLAPWRRLIPACQFVNHYGPTEATVGACHFLVLQVQHSSNSIPIGRPISNTRIYLLDQLCNPVPEGVTGEIYIGGAGVARGYLNRADLTAEKFIASPFVAGDRLYKTGDLGRYLGDGNIEFLGRNDFQVKIRGSG
jgi:non-ribosomal peptide synthetase component F